MRIFPKPVDPEATFEKGDLFKRKPLAVSLTSLALNVEDPIVCAIEGGWGTGKTTFLHMWKNELRKQGVPVIYFDAFLNDHYDDPLIPLAGEVFEIAQTLAADSPELKEWLGVACSFLKKLGKATTVLVVKGIAEVSGAGKLTEAIASSAVEAFSTPVDDLIGEYASKKRQIEEFRRTLKLLAERMSQAKKGEGSSRKKVPLVFIIDELDRCRPDFALSLLERVKHLFEVEGVHFFFGVNFPQLRRMVAARYGSGNEVANYLEKFFNLFFTLGSESASDQRACEWSFIYNSVSEALGARDDLRVRRWAELIRLFTNQLALSLREISRLCSAIAIGRGIIGRVEECRTYFVAACVLKLRSPEHFAKLCMGSLRFDEFSKSLPESFSNRGLTGGELDLAMKLHHSVREDWAELLDEKAVRNKGDTMSGGSARRDVLACLAQLEHFKL